MELVADLHLHSRFSRAVSPQMVIPEISRWAKRKGIGLVGAPDWTHPLWLRELKNELVEVGDGIYAAKAEPQETKFLLATEISSIYTQGGKVRRIHNVILAPSFAAVEEINAALRNRGANLLSDGRPIVGLSAGELAELILSIDKNCLIIPAHAWTPWFSLYGSKSGFDSINECFGNFADQIFAVETGLSSDPGMNWRIEELDSRAIVSFSDAHSPQKLGREATVFSLPASQRLSYLAIREAIIKQQIAYTIEFYPEEGKYHYTGHRRCGVVQSPSQTKKLGTTCSVCGKPLTIGVMHRVEQLAKRPANFFPPSRPPYKMLVPLMEILAEALESGFSSKSVTNEYNKLTTNFSSEFTVLLKTPVEEIAKIAGERIAEGIFRVRSGQVKIDPGYDGVFGTVKIWSFDKTQGKPEKQKQMSFF